MFFPWLCRIGYIMITDAEKGSSSQSRWRENCKTHEFLEERMQRNMREIHSIQDDAEKHEFQVLFPIISSLLPMVEFKSNACFVLLARTRMNAFYCVTKIIHRLYCVAAQNHVRVVTTSWLRVYEVDVPWPCPWTYPLFFQALYRRLGLCLQLQVTPTQPEVSLNLEF